MRFLCLGCHNFIFKVTHEDIGKSRRTGRRNQAEKRVESTNLGLGLWLVLGLWLGVRERVPGRGVCRLQTGFPSLVMYNRTVGRPR